MADLGPEGVGDSGAADDLATDKDQGPIGGTSDGGSDLAPDSQPAVDLGESRDAAPDLSPADAGPADPCPSTCAHLVECSLALCPGAGEADGPGLARECETACGKNPSVPIVLDPARPCADVVEFGRLSLDSAYLQACRPREPPVADGGACPYPCAPGEVCTGGHCVRPDGSCQTDYHCFTGREVCGAGRCGPTQYAPCQGDGDCAPPALVCRGGGAGNPGACVLPCTEDDLCPLNQICQPGAGGVCGYVACGGAEGNGELMGACRVGQRPGTCLPLAVGDIQPGGSPGICAEGGTTPAGGVCDAQALNRDDQGVGLRCAGGTLCLGDPDQPLDPADLPDGQGWCAGLCDPRAPGCGPAAFCLDVSATDDPATPGYDEARVLGLCLPIQCELFPGPDPVAPGCDDGESCRPLSLLSTAGGCGPTGLGGEGDPCLDNPDCGPAMVCTAEDATPGVCLRLCDPGAAEPDLGCEPDGVCYHEAGWQIGACVTPAGGQP